MRSMIVSPGWAMSLVFSEENYSSLLFLVSDYGLTMKLVSFGKLRTGVTTFLWSRIGDYILTLIAATQFLLRSNYQEKEGGIRFSLYNPSENQAFSHLTHNKKQKNLCKKQETQNPPLNLIEEDLIHRIGLKSPNHMRLNRLNIW